MKKALFLILTAVFVVSLGSVAMAATDGDTSNQLHLSTPPSYIHAGVVPVIEVSDVECAHLSSQPEYDHAGAVPIISAPEVEFDHLGGQPMYVHAGAVPVLEVPQV